MKKLTVIAMLAAATPLAAQETQDTFALREVVVSVTRTPMQRAATTAAVSVLQGPELRARGMRSVADALRTVPGAALVQSGSYGAFSSLFMRGGESDYVQVLIDGVQVNSPGEHFDFSGLTLENVERIEVVRGPVSVLYGSDAVAGVVQVFTKEGNGATRLEASIATGRGNRVGPTAQGRFGSTQFDAQLSGSAGRLRYSAGASDFRSDGAYAFNNDARTSGGSARAIYEVGASTLAATLKYDRTSFDYPTDGTGNLVDRNQNNLRNSFTTGLELATRFTPRLEARVLLGYNRNDDNYTDDPDSPADTLGFYAYYSEERFERTSADVRANYTLSARSLISAGVTLDEQKEKGWNRSESEFGEFPGESKQSRGNRALYAQLVGGVSRVDYQAGARFDDNDEFGSFLTYRGGISARVTDALRLRASAGTGFKQPRFYEQFATGYVKGNPDLDPETSLSVDAGAELSFGRTRVGATWFSQRFRDLIQYVTAPVTPDGPNYLNLGEARARGVEVEARHSFGAISANGSITFLKTKVTDSGVDDDPLFVEGSKLIRRPERSASLAVSWTRGGNIMSLTANYVGKRDDLDYTGWPPARTQLDAYTRVDAAAEAPVFAPGLRATLKIENLFNEAYEDAFNFPSRRRVVFLGVKYGR